MASKFLLLSIFALALNISTLLAYELEADRSTPPVIHVISTVTSKKLPPIRLRITAGFVLIGSYELSPGRDYQIKADTKDVNYASAVYGLKTALFNAYEPARDKGRTAVYWKADDWGVSISYDKINYQRVAPYQYE